MRINNIKNNQNFKALSPFSPALGQFYNANATLPTLSIETGVTLGRAYEANKRGGKPEAIDRLVEQGISAVVWIYGVKALKNIGDFFGKKFFDDLNFDIGFDELRNPLKNIDSKAVKFKAGNILISTAIATYFIGAILPKINNAILKKTLKKEEKNEVKTLNVPSFKDFQNKTKNISFTSLGVENLAHILENNSTARLLITDTGVIAGRFHNAPNKWRKIEGLFRDIASIYFYLKATEHISGGLNKLFNNDAAIDPKALEKTVEMLCKKLKENPELSNDEFYKLATENNGDVEKLKSIFKGKTISLKDFQDNFKNCAKKAEQMSAMQHPIEGKSVLSYQQALDSISNSWTSEPEFLLDTFNEVTDKNIADSKTFVSYKFLDKTRATIDAFIKQVYDKALKDEIKIDENYIKKIAKSNIRKNFVFNLIGTIISTFALGILIPKVQYAITKKMTNENKFHVEEE